MKKKYIFLSSILIILLSAACTALPASVATTASSPRDFRGSMLLGRPTNTEMTVSVTPDSQSTVYIEWGAVSGSYTHKSDIKTALPTAPAVFVMDGLSSDKIFYYRINYKMPGSSTYEQTAEHSFQTPRTAGEDYSFVIQADSHLLNKANKTVYTESMKAMAALDPDFVFDLGDTFLNDQVKTDPRYQDYEAICTHYTQQLPYFSLVASDAPLFLVMGNHEGEYGNFFDGTDKNLAVMATKARKTYYKNPVTNSFYSGNSSLEEYVGQPEDYYAFVWGDALYVCIDPYRYTTADPYNISSGWDWTLGKTQYDWFRKTLESSTAKYKFVFSHHVIGNIRGGALVVNLYEWGGYDRSGKYLFDEKRSGWGKPIQQIMKDTGVTIFFQGHDHLFAVENVDGVIYQTLPKPAETEADQQSNGDAYPDAYKLVNSGFLNVSVTQAGVQVDYNRNYCMLEGADQSIETGNVFCYTVDSSHNFTLITGSTEDFSNYGSTGNGGNSSSSPDSDKKSGTGTKKQNTGTEKS